MNRPLLFAFLIAAAVIVSYSSSFDNGFVYDDHFQLEANPLIKDFSHLKDLFTKDVWAFSSGTRSNNYRPLHLLSYAVIYSLFGLNPLAFHIFNVLLHLCCALLLWQILHKYVSGVPALLATLLFALHPVQVESVAWIGGIPNLLCAAFVFAAFLLFLNDHLYPSLVFYGLSIFSKEAAILFPLVVVVDQILFRRYERDKWNRWLLCCFGMIAFYLVCRANALGEMQLYDRAKIGYFSQIVSGLSIAGLYAAKWLFPSELNAYYDYQLPLSFLRICTGLGVLSSLMLFAVLFRRNRPFVFGILWFFILLAPVLFINAVSPTIFAERYLYLPSAGAAVAVAALPWRKSIAVLLIVLSALYGWISFSRSEVWANDFDLWRDTFDKSPHSVVVSFNLATAYAHRKDWENAEAYYARTVRLRKDYAEAYYGLAHAQHQMNQDAEAVASLQQFVRYWKGSEQKRREALGRIDDLVKIKNTQTQKPEN